MMHHQVAPEASPFGGADHRGPAETVRSLNDRFRRSFTGGRVVMTGVAALDEAAQARLLWAVRSFEAFTADNDPYGEHDFGAIEHAGGRYFWKIDPYDSTLSWASPDPSDPAVTVRMLTIMCADEY